MSNNLCNLKAQLEGPKVRFVNRNDRKLTRQSSIE